PPPPPPLPPAAAASEKENKAVRGPSYTTSDDEVLCHCWLDIPQDSIRGNDQKSETFWARVTEVYTAEGEKRLEQNAGSLMNPLAQDQQDRDPLLHLGEAD
ncbi:hypothetical protein BDK51DRAFT_18438, partial [Blyttiomyces helicus]